MRSLLLAVAVVALALAGCAKKEGPTTHVFSAASGAVSSGWTYDGVGVVPDGGALSGTLDTTTNKGIVNVSFDYLSSKYVATFDAFAESKPFMDGGVRFDFDEHGDSGNGDAALPKVHAAAAAWGTAKVTKDGDALVGKTGPLWTAHLMLLSDTVRGTDGRILNAAGTAPYDPAKPTDAKVVAGQKQAIFFIKSPDGETATRAPLNASKSLAFAGPPTTQSVDVPAEKGAGTLLVNVTFTGAQGPLPAVGNATVVLKDANGNATKKQDVTPIQPNNPAVVTFSVSGKDITGPFKVEIAGTGAFSAKVDYVLTYDDHPFLVVTWNDYVLD